MNELKLLLERIRAQAYTKDELLGIKRDIEWRLLNGLGKQKAKLANEIRGYLRIHGV